MYKSILIILSISFSSIASAEFIEFDWASPGDAGITYDSNTGLEWLDLSITANISVYDMNTSMLSGGAFEGWRYAQEQDLKTLTENYGLAFQHSYFETSPEAIAAADAMVDQILNGKLGIYQISAYEYVLRNMLYYNGGVVFEGLPHYSDDYDTGFQNYGSFIVREATVVPVPAAAWLFLTGMCALAGVTRRKKVAILHHDDRW